MIRGPDLSHVLAGCDEQQCAAITSLAAPLLVVAGAGSGKTRVLTRRIAWRVLRGDAAPAHLLALTFTRKAAGELRARLRDLGLPAPVTAGTFHSVALAQLRMRADDTDSDPPTVLDSKAPLLARLLAASTTAPRRQVRSIGRRELLASVAGEIEWAKARLISPARYCDEAEAAGRTPLSDLADIAGWFARYEREKRHLRVLDFEDLLDRLVEEMASDPAFAAVQRWRFQHLFVDELQDANPAQLRLLDSWLGPREDLFAVGDPRQAIYGWNGADPSAVTTFVKRYPGSAVIELETNYRSTPQVVTVASAVLAPGGSTQMAAGPDGSTPTVTEFPSDLAEASSVVAALRKRHRPGSPWSTSAILARTNAQLVLFESALSAAGVPFRGSVGSAFLARPTVREELARLESRAGRDAFTAWLEDLMLDADRESEADLATSDTVARHGVADGEREFDLAVLARVGSDYRASDITPSASGFLAFLRQTLRDDPQTPAADGVDLLTFHRAKGLEWQIVFVTGIEDGLVPIAHAQTSAAWEEERRLLYVALSRATRELHCSWSRERTFGRRTTRRDPSPFLPAVEEACRSVGKDLAFDPDRAKAAIAATRAQLEGTSAPEQSVTLPKVGSSPGTERPRTGSR
ncbi:MAG TPA: ATP-dependent helicase [Acidimicrobiales bacterium]|nr:ATP-dependent helicase [Acidimicrobiales bacterium]